MRGLQKSTTMQAFNRGYFTIETNAGRNVISVWEKENCYNTTKNDFHMILLIFLFTFWVKVKYTKCTKTLITTVACDDLN